VGARSSCRRCSRRLGQRPTTANAGTTELPSSMRPTSHHDPLSTRKSSGEWQERSARSPRRANTPGVQGPAPVAKRNPHNPPGPHHPQHPHTRREKYLSDKDVGSRAPSRIAVTKRRSANAGTHVQRSEGRREERRKDRTEERSEGETQSGSNTSTPAAVYFVDDPGMSPQPYAGRTRPLTPNRFTRRRKTLPGTPSGSDRVAGRRVLRGGVEAHRRAAPAGTLAASRSAAQWRCHSTQPSKGEDA
jgi:hypothetical protein